MYVCRIQILDHSFFEFTLSPLAYLSVFCDEPLRVMDYCVHMVAAFGMDFLLVRKLVTRAYKAEVLRSHDGCMMPMDLSQLFYS